MLKNIVATFAIAAASLAFAASVQAAEVPVKMLNKGSNGEMMVFEPALVKISPGDSVHFIATDKSHNIESAKGMLPDGANAFAGKMNEDLTVKFDKPGVYGVDCKPHMSMGMVALVVVGKPTNEDAMKKAAESMPGLAKKKFAKLFDQLDGKQ